METKVNVWILGYSTQKDAILDNRQSAVCKNMGYVTIPDNNVEHWEDEVWNLLNWSLFGNKKPKQVHSSIDHCCSDVILQVDGTDEYLCAGFIGWGTMSSLDDAIREVKYGYSHRLSVLPGVSVIKGRYSFKEGRVFVKATGKEELIEVM